MDPFPEISHCWKFHWSATELDGSKNFSFSDFIDIGNHMKAIRLSIDYSTNNQNIRVTCHINNIERFGFSLMAVTSAYTVHQVEEVKQLRQLRQPENPLAYTTRISGLSFFDTSSSKTLIFHFYLVGSVKNYVDEQFDSLVGDQLWQAAVDKKYTDVEFKFSEDCSLTAHKFILVTRSSVFYAMFTNDMEESRTGIVHIVDADREDFEELLFFLYTGQLRKPTDLQLGMLAEKYNVETLSALCQTAAEKQNNPDINLATATHQRDPDEDNYNRVEQTGMITNCSDTFCVCYSLEFGTRSGGDQCSMNCRQIFHYAFSSYLTGGGEEMFAVKLGCSYQEGATYDVSGFDVCLPDIPLDDGTQNGLRYERMKPFTDRDYPDLPLFRIDLLGKSRDAPSCSSPNLRLKVIAQLQFDVQTYRYQPRDKLLYKHIWGDISDTFADIILNFDEAGKKIPAHRAVLAARSPFMAKLLLNSKKNDTISVPFPSRAGLSVIYYFLSFVYTGMMSNEDYIRHEKIMEAAEIWMMLDTLPLACKAANKPAPPKRQIQYYDFPSKYSSANEVQVHAY